MRTCPKCNETKDLSLFNKSKSKASGVDTYCKECTKLIRKSLSTKEKIRNSKLSDHEVTQYQRMCRSFCNGKGHPEQTEELYDIVIDKVLKGQEIFLDICYIDLMRNKFGRSKAGEVGPKYELNHATSFDKLEDYRSVKYERKQVDIIKELRVKFAENLGERRLLAFFLNTFFEMQVSEIAVLYGVTEGFISQMITYVKNYIKENDEDFKND